MTLKIDRSGNDIKKIANTDMVPAVCQAIVKGLYIESLISKGGAILSPFIDEKKPAKNSPEGGEKSGRCSVLEFM